MATVPVGAVMDPTKFTPDFLTDVRAVQNMRPKRVEKKLEMQFDGSTRQDYSLAIPNPGKYPLEITITPEVGKNWRVVPDHQHLVIPPGKTDGMDFHFYRGDASLAESTDRWEGFRIPAFEMNVDYLHESARIRFPAVTLPVDIGLASPSAALPDPAPENCLVLNELNAGGPGGRTPRGYLKIESSGFDLPNGPMTLEAWVNPTALDGSRAVVAKTQASEYAFFLNNGVPGFDLHLNGRYVSPRWDQAIPLNQWTHLAGVYDGKHVSLYVNGRCVQSLEGTGQWTRNRLPLLIGADPDGNGNATRHFSGRIDEVRLSKVARYKGSFEPSESNPGDTDTVLLLHLDWARGPFLRDDSVSSATVLKFGNTQIGPLER